MNEGRVTLERRGPVAFVTFDRPDARNAMTRAMYADLRGICEELATDEVIHVAVFRGAGGKAFVAGSDIAIFDGFQGGEDGIAYEAEMEGNLQALASLPIPTIAVIEGWAVGGGLATATACDFRIATPDSRFGVPIARTIGNCLSIFNYARLVAEFGPARTKRMLMLGDMLSADEALACGFLSDVVAAEGMDDRVQALCDRILGNAPVSMRVSKQMIGRVHEALDLTEAEDLVAEVYGSRDFKHGVSSFRSKTKPVWEGH